MDQQNIDRLFREKLDALEITPSEGAWTQVEKQIQTKKAPTFYWIAASVTLLLLSWLIWPAQDQSTGTYAASEVDHPMIEMQPDFNVPVAITLEEEKEVKRITPKIRKPAQTSKIQTLLATNKEDKVTEDRVELSEQIETKTMVVQEELKVPIIEDTVLPENEMEKMMSTAKITYIASSNKELTYESEQKSDTTNAIKKFIAFAEKIDPGEMLADIKTAKDNLLNGGLKNKKERSVMTP